MVLKKKFKRKRSRKKYTSEEKFRYHAKRDTSCGSFGLEFGGTKHSYSSGFVDAFHGIDNSRATGREFGKASEKSYIMGHARGKAAAKDYFLTTGKQPYDLNKYNN